MTTVAPEGPFISAIALAVRQAGAVALGLQGRVANEGKSDATSLPNDDDALRRRRAAKTVVDEVIQEILLLAAFRALAPEPVALDAEEATSSQTLFRADADGNRCLVIDPVDGTLEYIAGQSSYSVCVGLVGNHRLDAVIVHFPARDTAYVLDETGTSFKCHGVAAADLTKAEPLRANETAESRVYVNGRVPDETQQRLTAAGFEVVDDTTGGIGAPDCILSCLTGRAAAYVSHTRQMRDILLGAVVGAAEGGYACDWTGADLAWPAGGRVPRAVFGSEHSRAAVLACLSTDDEIAER